MSNTKERTILEVCIMTIIILLNICRTNTSWINICRYIHYSSSLTSISLTDEINFPE